MSITKIAAVTAVSIIVSVGYAQNRETELTAEERLERLEAQLVAVETRLEARTRSGAGSLASSDRGIEIATRVDALERRMDTLANELNRASRQAEQALRQAAQADRTAARAHDLARDAARLR